MTKDNLYSNYTQLLVKVDEAFAAVSTRHSQSFSCGPGCFSCCRSGLSVLPVEAEYIKDWLQNNPAVKSMIKDKKTMMNAVSHCEFLDNKGCCVIYEARPIICRSHGAPISWTDPEQVPAVSKESRDVCPLNFKGEDIYALDGQDVISLDKLNTLLSLINRHITQSDDATRVPLQGICDGII